MREAHAVVQHVLFLPFFEFLLLTKQDDLMYDNTNKEVYR